MWRCGPIGVMTSKFLSFLEHTITHSHTTVGRTPLHEWSVRRRDLYLTTHNAHNRQTQPYHRQDSNPQSKQASGHLALDRATTGTGSETRCSCKTEHTSPMKQQLVVIHRYSNFIRDTENFGVLSTDQHLSNLRLTK